MKVTEPHAAVGQGVQVGCDEAARRVGEVDCHAHSELRNLDFTRRVIFNRTVNYDQLASKRASAPRTLVEAQIVGDDVKDVRLSCAAVHARCSPDYMPQASTSTKCYCSRSLRGAHDAALLSTRPREHDVEILNTRAAPAAYAPRATRCPAAAIGCQHGGLRLEGRHSALSVEVTVYQVFIQFADHACRRIINPVHVSANLSAAEA